MIRQVIGDDMLVRVIYASRATEAVTHETAEDILAAARMRNEVNDITGVLIFSDARFLQILEGPSRGLEQLLDNLKRDPHHTDLKLLYRTVDERRIFADWEMGYIGPGRPVQDFSGLAGLAEVIANIEADVGFATRFMRDCRSFLLGGQAQG